MADVVEVKHKPAEVKGRQYVWGTGRRKAAVARVRIAEGAGTIKVNGREVDAFFSDVEKKAAELSPPGGTQPSTGDKQ